MINFYVFFNEAAGYYLKGSEALLESLELALAEAAI